MATATRNLTDRALRYRANQAIPEHAKVCAFCGDKDVEVGHVDGHEENDSPDNLTYTCRPCNVIAANTLRKAGMGRKTVQFNPTRSGGASSVGEWLQAVWAITPRVDRGERPVSTMSVPDAVAMIRATPHAKRSEFARLLKRRNPQQKPNMWPFGPGQPLGSREYVYKMPKRKETTARRTRGTQEDSPTPKLVGFYKGYKVHRTPDGEFFTSLDSDSWYPTLAAAKRSVDDWQKGRTNPKRKKRGPLQKGLATGLDIYDATWDYTGGLPSKILRKYAGNPNSHDLIREAQTSRNAEELARLYKYAVSKGDAELQTAVESRAAAMKIPHEKLTKRYGWEANPKPRPFGPIVLYSGPSHAEAINYLKRAIAHGGYVGLQMRAAGGTWKVAADEARKRNPEAGSERLYEIFHGREPQETVEIHEDVHVHEWLGTLGDLTEIYVDTVTGLRLHLTWEGRDDLPFLAATEDGKQLYIKGGKQTLDLKAIKMDGPEWVKDRMVIGQFSPPDPCSKCGSEFKYSEARNLHVCSQCRHVADDNDRVHNITYRTEKDFDHFEPIDYQHDLGEVSGVRPMLEYEPRNNHLYVTGGQYHIELPVFETSPGIEN